MIQECFKKSNLSTFQAQKQILDTELDIITKQNEGEDTSELRRRVAELKREVKCLHNAKRDLCDRVAHGQT